MTSKEDKKKLLDIRLNEGNSVHALKTMQQGKDQLHKEHTSLKTDDSPQKKSFEDFTVEDQKKPMPEAPAVSVDSTSLQPEETAAVSTALETPEVVEMPSESLNTEIPEAEIVDTRSKPRRILDKVLIKLGGVIPKRGDPPLEIVRKCVFMVALVTLIASLSYIFNDMVVSPFHNDAENQGISALYNPGDPVDPPTDFTDYPDGILPAFKALYARNQDLRGFIKFSDTSKNWLNISLPVVQATDNDYYLKHDFNKQNNNNGSLFFDYRNKIDSPSSTNKALIIYGHDMASGQMFGSFYHFIQGINYARTAPLINLDTIYQENQYKVFAVMVVNNNPKDGQMFDYLRTDFNSTKDFMDFVANIRARSLYSYNGVDVKPDDQLLILSSCSRESMVHFDDGRVVIVARKVRSEESSTVDGSNILTNDNVIMPEAWYKNQGKPDHPYYSGNYTIPGLYDDSSDTTVTDTSANTTESATTVGEQAAADTTTKKGTAGTTKNTTGKVTSPANPDPGTHADNPPPQQSDTQPAPTTTRQPDTTTTTAAPATTTEKSTEKSAQTTPQSK